MRRALTALALWVVFSLGGAQAQTPNKQKLLILHSYHQGYQWTDSIHGELMAAFANRPDVDLFVEYMDLKRQNGPRYPERLFQCLSLRYPPEAWTFDGIICTDDGALDFLLAEGKPLFPGIPIVFCGANAFQPKRLRNAPHVTGVNESVSVRETLELALRLRPAAQKIVAISGNTQTARRNLDLLKLALPRFSDLPPVVFLDNQSPEALREALSRLSSKDIVLYLSYLRTPDGRNLTVDESVSFLSGATDAPLFGCWDFLLGHGLLGGKVVSGRAQGRAAAAMMERILRGDNPSDIPLLMESPNEDLFDYRQLQRFQIPRSLLPEGSQLLFEPSGLWAVYRYWILGGLLFVIIETVLIVQLIFSRQRQKRAEEELSYNLGLFNALLDTLPTPFFYKDMEGRYQLCNQAFCRQLLDLPLSEIQGKRMDQLIQRIPTDLQKIYKEKDEAILDEDATQVYEAPVQCSDGVRRPFLFHKTLFCYPRNEAAGVVGIMTNLSELREMERALAESEARLRATVEAIPDLLFRFSPEAVFLDCHSPEPENLLASPEHFLGKSALDILPPPIGQLTLEKVQAALTTGEVQTYDYEMEIDGVQRVYETRMVPCETQDTLAIVRDVTESKRASEKIRLSEERLAMVIKATDAGIWDWQVPGNLLSINARWAEMLGYTLEELQPLSLNTWRNLCHPEDLKKSDTLLEEHFDGKEDQYDCEVRMRHKDGHWVWIHDRGSVVERDEAGRPLRVTGTHLDISQRKAMEIERQEMEKKMQQTQKLESLGVLAGGIAHDFNNILMAILGNADLALTERKNPYRIQGFLEDIRTASRHAADLCSQMLAYAGKGKYVLELIDLSRLVQEMSHLLQTSLSKNATLRLDLTKEIHCMEGDLTQMRQVLMNLVVNAGEALQDKGGVVRIHTSRQHFHEGELDAPWQEEPLPAGDYVVLQVSDTGCGMGPETQKRIFEPFYTTKFTGRGLGLSAVLGIVHSHNGALHLTSKTGEGSTFTLFFPVAKKEPGTETGTTSPAPVSTQPQHFSGTVLLVDDEDSVRNLGQKMLKHLGMETRLAANGPEGLDLFAREKENISAIFLDLTMPGMDGLEAFNRFREMEADIPIVICSGYTVTDLAQRFKEKKVAAFLHKPYVLKDLEKCLKKALASG